MYFAIPMNLELPHFILLFIILILGILLPRLEPLFQSIIEKQRKKRFLNFGDSPEFHSFLLEKSSYYKNLDSDFQIEFRYRVYTISRSCRFYGMDGIKIQDEHRWLICMAAVQLNFGLGEYRLPILKNVVVHPGIFNKGHYGLIHFYFEERINTLEVSLKAFEDGFKNQSDGINAGLHALSSVMASLVKNHLNNDRVYEYFLPDALEQVYDEYASSGSEKKMFFGDKTITDEYQFLAVAIERFFEQSAKMKLLFPGIYQNLCLLHQQDPLNQKTNYLLDKDFILKANKNTRTPSYPIGFYFLKKGSTYKTGVFLSVLIMIALLPLGILANACREAFWLIISLNLIGGLIYTISAHWSRFFFPSALTMSSLMIGLMEGAALTLSLIFIQHYMLPSREVEVHVELNQYNCTPNCVLNREDIPEIYRDLSLFKISLFTFKEKLKDGKIVHFDMYLSLDLLDIKTDEHHQISYSDN